MLEAPSYSKVFFETIKEGSMHSAQVIVPIALDLIDVKSVVDVGCGTGEFLKTFQSYGVQDILGIDGEYVDRDLLAIPQENFLSLDISIPFSLERIYDLAVCLEVAEHLPPESACGFVESLTQLAPIILFSAAIPLQGGDHHVNEQWPEYWANLFKMRGFVPVDAIRERIWKHAQVEWWYRQNIMFFCDEQALCANPKLEKEFHTTNVNMLSVVHPELYWNRQHLLIHYWKKLQVALKKSEGMTPTGD
jgi:SAM-dependent methyltransferase